MTVRNVILNPRLNQAAGIELHNATIRNTPDTPAYGINQNTGSWSLNLKCKDTTLDQPNAYAMLETDCDGLAGVAVVAAARCAGFNAALYQSRTLMLAAFDSANNMIGTANYGKTTDANPHLITLEWTVPAGTSRLEYRLYTTIDGSIDVWWSQPLLCTKTDWQKLAGYGLTYFNGDTMPSPKEWILHPFADLVSSTEFWSSLLLALVGGGGIGGLATSLYGRQKSTAESESLSAQAAKEAVSILTDQVIAPLREQVDAQEKQIEHLERQQAKLFAATSYIRAQNHWLDELCRSGLLGSKWADEHPKPRLPGMLRDTIDTTQDQKEEP